ncbi:uncharacterized protein LOC659404 isoform X2 [Tribolium castaneum]|uniref:Uncharacterized protein n=1 Tax=Tribolium castaneum TaxID=7070 RepID=A0A139WDH6_TRICA|nr:PREDICTED: uncharacterized protein LOC659404 isoform X2 [Tribolium castaneum]XP_976315.1 PREDICTED: uncharacterized protein LOC659404 isoform X2 [Tribolium castaneum]KYB25993.1 hypothetical protein TcasGA2_TC005863 [Tribolium castaneum]|eukprot:XP_008196646.1 PREDICTED: uncharacterized protein LOC659404 isoform X2 [Tribolium castaneum]
MSKVTDPLLLDIEKFMKEKGNLPKPSAESSKDKSYVQTTQEEKQEQKNSIRVKINLKDCFNQTPKMRPPNECDHSNDLPSRKHKLDPENKKKHSKKHYKIRICKGVINYMNDQYAAKTTYPRRRRPKIRFYPPSCLNRAVVRRVQCRNDCTTIKTAITIKEEVIDLTSDESTCFMQVKFGVQNEFNFSEIECYLFEPSEVVPSFGAILSELKQAQVYIPDVRFDTTFNFIDLTCDSEEIEDLAISSEKECANRILHIIYQYHKLHHVQLSVENTLSQLQHPCPDDNLTFQFLSQRASLLGCSLAQILSKTYVRNFDIQRFVDILVHKFEETYQRSIENELVLSYLCTMLGTSQAFCAGGTGMKILNLLQVRTKEEPVKGEEEECQVVFTTEQLDQLQLQIFKYHEIVARQELLEGGDPFERCESKVML